MRSWYPLATGAKWFCVCLKAIVGGEVSTLTTVTMCMVFDFQLRTDVGSTCLTGNVGNKRMSKTSGNNEV